MLNPARSQVVWIMIESTALSLLEVTIRQTIQVMPKPLQTISMFAT